MRDYKPAVGDKCEMMGNNVWVRVEVIAWISGLYVGWSHKDKTVFYSDNLADFRPLHTQEEIEREEAIEAMSEYFSEIKFSDHLPVMLGRLYDTGYRLVGEKVDINQLSSDLYNHLHTVIKLDDVCKSWIENNYDIFRKVVK